jgi:hypothetical protein
VLPWRNTQPTDRGQSLDLLPRLGFPENDPRGGFDNCASNGLAWSDDLWNWGWPTGDGDE